MDGWQGIDVAAASEQSALLCGANNHRATRRHYSRAPEISSWQVSRGPAPSPGGPCLPFHPLPCTIAPSIFGDALAPDILLILSRQCCGAVKRNECPGGTPTRPKRVLTFQDAETGIEVVLVGTMHYNPASIADAVRCVSEAAEDGVLASLVIESCPERWALTNKLQKPGSLLRAVLDNEFQVSERHPTSLCIPWRLLVRPPVRVVVTGRPHRRPCSLHAHPRLVSSNGQNLCPLLPFRPICPPGLFPTRGLRYQVSNCSAAGPPSTAGSTLKLPFFRLSI